MEPLQADDPGQVGRYRLEGRLGIGGMGRVYAATSPDGRRAAIKVIRDDLAEDTAFRHRSRREVAAASAVAGMFTARVLDADPDDDPPWLATEFVEGPSLRDAVLAEGPMPEHALLELARGLAEALAAIHAAGLVHRDLKPANVLLSPAGPRVIDFGIARAVDSSRLTATGQIIGTPDFMAPEQIEGTGESCPEGDVFALGSTLAWAATQRGPFAADQTAATLYRIITMPPDLRGMPPRMASVVAACLAKDPAQRPTAVHLAVQLRGVGSAGSGLSAGATVTSRPGATGHGTGALPARGNGVRPHAGNSVGPHAGSGAYHGAATLASPPGPPRGLPQVTGSGPRRPPRRAATLRSSSATTSRSPTARSAPSRPRSPISPCCGTRRRTRRSRASSA